jgi:hypothetical protein
MFSLMLRELTPEDYETLLRLDERNPKKPAADTVTGIAVQVAQEAGLADGLAACGICLLVFAPQDLTKRLSCGHAFHCECVDRWLKDYADRCPVDNLKITNTTFHNITI